MTVENIEGFKSPEFFFDGNYKEIKRKNYLLSLSDDCEPLSIDFCKSGCVITYFDKTIKETFTQFLNI